MIAHQDGTISILLGNGDGMLQPQYTVAAVPSGSPLVAWSVVISDFNNNGHADLAVLCLDTTIPAGGGGMGTTVNILLNDGTAHFGGLMVIPLNTSTETGPAQILSARFGTDTNVDLAVLNTGSGNVSIFCRNGDGRDSNIGNRDAIGVDHPQRAVEPATGVILGRECA